MSKFQFPDLTSEDEKIIKSFCKMFGYQSVIDRKNKIAKIKYGGKSVYIVKIMYKGQVVLGTAKTEINSNGELVYKKFENLYTKYQEALQAKKLFPQLSGKVDLFLKAVFGLAYFIDVNLKKL